MRKYVVGASLLAVLAVAALAGYLYMQREQLLQRAIEHYGSEILGASVSVSSVRFAPGDGDGAIRGLRIGPPLGFDRDVATADAIELSIEPASITKDVVRVRRIALQAPAIVYEQRTSGTNLNALQRNVQHYLGDTSADERRAQTKFIVDRLVIRGARVTYLPLGGISAASAEVQLPDIVLQDIGKQRGGVTAGELAKIVMDAVIARTASALGQRALDRTVKRLFSR